MFSIIVPSYNRNQEINALLESLKQQTAYNFEVIIVDDCSKIPVSETLGILNEFNDISTKEKVRELLTRDSLSHIYSYPFDVKVVRNNPNVGAAQSRNVGATNATQEWLLFLDDDD
ncbi:TPA: glycosyltransferase family 2 protein, partial [Mannheimia haemolytica]|nr:glycosyltransferase family 2 protein [Mannheimia haemolytica]